MVLPRIAYEFLIGSSLPCCVSFVAQKTDNKSRYGRAVVAKHFFYSRVKRVWYTAEGRVSLRCNGGKTRCGRS